jgi:hypothetical protein
MKSVANRYNHTEIIIFLYNMKSEIQQLQTDITIHAYFIYFFNE